MPQSSVVCALVLLFLDICLSSLSCHTAHCLGTTVPTTVEELKALYSSKNDSENGTVDRGATEDEASIAVDH